MQVLTDLKSEKTETVYNEMIYYETECSEPAAGIFAKNGVSFSELYTSFTGFAFSYAEVLTFSITFPPTVGITT